MLRIIQSPRDISFSDLMYVYAQSIQEAATQFDGYNASGMAILEAEQDLYSYIKDFLNEKDTFLAVWCPAGRCEAILRCEPYRDGFLITGLETACESRGKGYAKHLLKETVIYCKSRLVRKLYSHVGKDNEASKAVHRFCGFVKISDHASYIDGTVDTLCHTYLCT